MGAEPISLSVIVPLGPDERAGGELLCRLARDLPDNWEILAVEADGAISEARRRTIDLPGIEWCSSRRGRARQMNMGARRSTGEWIWFLHADSNPEPGYVLAIERFIRENQGCIGWFHLGFEPGGTRLMALNAWGANMRSRLFSIPFGDQGMVVEAESFWALGGFNETVDCGEDHHFAWKAKNTGIASRPIGVKIWTSSRKYDQQGWLRVTARHLLLTSLQAMQWRRRL